MPRDLSAATRPASSAWICAAMARPSMRFESAITRSADLPIGASWILARADREIGAPVAAPLIEHLNPLNRNDRRVLPALVHTFLARDNDVQTFVAVEVEVG